MKLTFSFVFTLIFLTSCSTIRSTSTWPQDIPPRSYFVDYYEERVTDKDLLSQNEYLTWIHRFYFGWELYARGWIKSTDVLSKTLEDHDDSQLAKEKALLLGRVVSPEWAKSKGDRVINTRHLNIWGNVINESIVRKEQLAILDKILFDANALLEKKIRPRDITFNRYYKVEEFGEFGDGDDFS